MNWDLISPFYDFAVGLKNGKVNRAASAYTASLCASEDRVLECACGTGIFTQAIAPVCGCIVATDSSESMLRKTARKCRNYSNVKVEFADILDLPYPDESFDKVIAANVIHLLESPEQAVRELCRVCRTGGTVIIPTYLWPDEERKSFLLLKLMHGLGVQVRKRFYGANYRRFFEALGINELRIMTFDGKILCGVASFQKPPGST